MELIEMDIILLEFIVFEIIFEVSLIVVTVLVINPKSTTQKVKKTILDDKAFISSVVKEIVSVDQSIYDPLMERFRQKMLGTINALENNILPPSEVKAITKDLAQDVLNQNPEIMTLLDMFPSVKKRVMANPALINTVLELMQRMGPQVGEYLREHGIIE